MKRGLLIAAAVVVFGAGGSAALLTPNSEAGNGWRLLAAVPGGEPHRAIAATDASSLATLADELGSRELSAIELSDELVIAFTVTTNSGILGCETIGFRGLLIENGVVAGRFRRPVVRIGCNDDALLKTFVIALERDMVPADGFELKLSASTPTAIRVDLPGSEGHN